MKKNPQSVRTEGYMFGIELKRDELSLFWLEIQHFGGVALRGQHDAARLECP